MMYYANQIITESGEIADVIDVLEMTVQVRFSDGTTDFYPKECAQV